MLSQASSRKLAKLLPMLASDKDGEVAGAARAIGRALAADNLDFHDLARILVGRGESEFGRSAENDARHSRHEQDVTKESPEDRRFETRFRKVLQAGKILLPNGGILDCRLRNRSANGALLEMASLIGVPDQFILRVPSTDEMFGVQIIWRGEREIGVRRL